MGSSEPNFCQSLCQIYLVFRQVFTKLYQILQNFTKANKFTKFYQIFTKVYEICDLRSFVAILNLL